MYLTDAGCPGVDELVLGSCSVLARGVQSIGGETATLVTAQPGSYRAFLLAAGQYGAAGTVEFTLAH